MTKEGCMERASWRSSYGEEDEDEDWIVVWSAIKELEKEPGEEVRHSIYNKSKRE
jgi:hypothetical protein